MAKLIDIHVHMLGNGGSGSGCWLDVHGTRRAQARAFLYTVGLPQKYLNGDLDTAYAEWLLRQVRTSSLDAAVIFAHERPYHEDGKPIAGYSTFYTPNSFVLKLAKEHPEFLAGVAIHPTRLDAMEELERCLEGGAALLKILPNCQNINCNDSRYEKFWRRMAEAKLPLLAHTGGELSMPVYSREYQTPGVLRLPLECGVTVIAAHCGTKSGPADESYLETFVAMLGKYPNLFGDTSALTMPFRTYALRRCLEPDIQRRLLHGSDCPVPVWAWALLLRGLITWSDYLRARRQPNPIEREYQLKRAMGFEDHVFARAASLLRSGHG